MKTMIEAFTSVFFIAVISILLVSMIGSYMSVNNARNYHASIIDRLENSDYQDEFIDELYEEASNKGYSIEIINVTMRMNRHCYYVKLEYDTDMNIFGLINKMFNYKGVIEGYAT